MEDLCSACLCSGRKLTCISGTSVYYFYKQIVNEIADLEEMPQLSKICWECNALLHRFQCFQQQVKCCYVELLMCLQQNSSLKPSLAKPPHLQTQLLPSISYPEVKPESLDIKVEADEVHCEPETFVNMLTWSSGCLEGKTGPEVIVCGPPSVGRRRGRRRGEGMMKKKEKKKVKVKKEIAYESDLDTTEHIDDTNDEDLDRIETNLDKVRTSVDRIDTDVRTETNAERMEKNEDRMETVLDRNETSVDKSDEKVSCEQCMDRFTTQSELDSHIELEHDVTGHESAGARAKGRSREALPERPQCVECGKIFSSRKTYRYHLNVLHKGQNRHPCPRCGKVYQWKSNLGRHMRTHKARESGELYCVKCDKSFASVATYRQHIRISRRHVSESEFTFTCDECGKKFVNKTRLRDHVDWEHLNKIKFRCQLCNKPFKCHTSLYVHLQNVHRNKEKKDNLCHVCGKSYQNAAKLKYHIVAMHTSETPYRCADCDAAFGWYSSLYRHVREVHYKMKIQTKKNKKEKKLQLQELVPLPAGLPGP